MTNRSLERRRRPLEAFDGAAALLRGRGRSALNGHRVGGPMEAASTAALIARAHEAPAAHAHKHEKCDLCSGKPAEKGVAPAEPCAKCSAAKEAKPAEMKAKKTPSEKKTGCAHSPLEGCSICAGAAVAPMAEGDDTETTTDSDSESKDDGTKVTGGSQPDKEAPAECKPCAFAEAVNEVFGNQEAGPAEAGWITGAALGDRPMEAGWWTGRTPTSNTIGCDGGGSLTVMANGATYQHGVQDCTIAHEKIHVRDWQSRYGAKVCEKRAKGDLPYFDPPGKDAYAGFLKKSECSAWKVGGDCRQKKLDACTTDACKKYVKPHVDFAGRMQKRYCG